MRLDNRKVLRAPSPKTKFFVVQEIIIIQFYEQDLISYFDYY